jgi:hypothetical protein
MKENLENFEWHVYGLRFVDFDYTYDLVKNIIHDRINQLRLKMEEFEAENGEPLNGEAIYDEIYYNDLENTFLWHFTLWRLQGIFEGILMQHFIRGKKDLFGLSKKLEAVREEGFFIDESDFKELLKWGKLRNALSHSPPEQFRPGNLEQEDIEEYLNQVKRVTLNLYMQKEKKADQKMADNSPDYSDLLGLFG